MVIEAVVHRLLPVISHAIAVFGDERKAADWFDTPLSLIGNRAPSKLLETEEGTLQIKQILTRVEHNIPS